MELNGSEVNGTQRPAVVPFVLRQPDKFDLFWQLFIAAGKPLNDRDKERSLRLWMNYDPPEHEQIIFWCMEQMKSTWRDIQHTPSPENALKSEGWKRIASPRIIPDPKPIGRSFVEDVRQVIGERMARGERPL